MEIKSYNLLNVGVGGQGVIRAAQILSYAALLEDYKVRTAETHGMAQRGGSVASYLRFGTEVEGPLVPRGKTEFLKKEIFLKDYCSKSSTTSKPFFFNTSNPFSLSSNLNTVTVLGSDDFSANVYKYSMLSLLSPSVLAMLYN